MSDSPSPFSDDQAVGAVLRGDRRAFEILVQRYGKKIVLFVNRMIGDYDEAESIAQESFLKIFENLRYYRMEGNFSAFIFKIARNLTLNHIKRQKRTLLFSRMLGRAPERELPDARAPGRSPHEEIESAQADQRLQQAMRAISEDQRLAVILKVYLDFSYKEIAKITGWSIPKIETLISRGRTALKKRLALQETGRPHV